MKKKTVFLFTTTVGDILQEGYNLIDKLKEILRLCDYRNGSVIIWRPHPLSWSTIQSMRPELQSEYEEVVRVFKAKSNTIYDEYADYQKTMSIADAYIGSKNSSLFKVFKTTGKPMYEIDFKWNTLGENGLLLGTASVAEYEKKVFLFSAWFNGLFSVDYTIGKVDFISTFKGSKDISKLLYFGTYVYGKKIFYLPYFLQEVAVYHLDTKKVEYILLNSKKDGALSSVNIEGCLYLLTDYYSDYMYVIDLETLAVDRRRMKEAEGISEEDKHILLDKTARFYGNQVVGDCVYRVCYSMPVIQCCHLVSGQVVYYRLFCKNSGFRGISYDGESFWLLSKKHEDLIIWNKESNQVVCSLKYPELLRTAQQELLFYKIVYWESYMWLIPEQSNFIVKIDIFTKKMKCINIHPKGIHNVLPGTIQCYEYHIEENYLYLFPFQSNTIVCLNMINDTVREIQVCFDSKEFNESHSYKLENILARESCETYYEGFCSLETFFSIVEQKEGHLCEKRDMVINENEVSGKRIWNLIKERRNCS